jgi:hypothetical protein
MENQQRINIDVIIKTPTPIDEGSKQVIQDAMRNGMSYFTVLTYLVSIVEEDLLKNPKFDPSDELFDVLSIAHIYLNGLITNNKIDEKSVSDLYRKIDSRLGNFDNVFQDM